MMLVQDIMSTPVITVRRENTVDEIARLMVEHNISGIPVVDEDNGTVIGIVTDADMIVRNAHLHFPRFIQIMEGRIYLESTQEYNEELRKSLGVTAGELMSDKIYTIAPDADVSDAATLMVDRKINALPVVDASGLPVGIISRADFVRLMAQQPPGEQPKATE